MVESWIRAFSLLNLLRVNVATKMTDGVEGVTIGIVVVEVTAAEVTAAWAEIVEIVLEDPHPTVWSVEVEVDTIESETTTYVVAAGETTFGPGGATDPLRAIVALHLVDIGELLRELTEPHHHVVVAEEEEELPIPGEVVLDPVRQGGRTDLGALQDAEDTTTERGAGDTSLRLVVVSARTIFARALGLPVVQREQREKSIAEGVMTEATVLDLYFLLCTGKVCSFLPARPIGLLSFTFVAFVSFI
jgi:hypothetical protein